MTPDSGKSEARRLVSPELLRFLVVGASNTLLSYGVFQLLLRAFEGFALRGTVSQMITYAIGTAWSYFWSRKWTFRSTQPALGEATRFVTLQVILAVTSMALIGVLVDWLQQHPTLSWVGVMGVITVGNYTASKWWVFAQSARK